FEPSRRLRTGMSAGNAVREPLRARHKACLAWAGSSAMLPTATRHPRAAPSTRSERTPRRRSRLGSLRAHLRGDLAKAGFAVTVFEALHTPGGVLVYGIP
ncbi:MAG: hypothetical protein V8T53_00650, partial [Eubacteriales bacterium]